MIAFMEAGIYARISKDTEGTELGVTRQQEDCRAEATRRGWNVKDLYIDNDVSATRSKVRPSYQRMMRDVTTGRINAIVVWDVDRLTRTPRELEDLIDLADKYGVAFANVGGDIDLSTPDGRMMARIKGTLARREVEQMSKRLRRKFQQKAESGEPHGYSPYGFTRVEGVDVVNEEQAAVVREVAARVLAHESLRSIVTDLNARGIHGPKSPQWNSTILRQILVRPSNAGLRQYQGKVIGKSTTQPIYDEGTHNRLVSLLTDPSRRSNHVGPGYKYLLSGVAICGRDGTVIDDNLGRRVEGGCRGVMRRQIGRTTTSKRTGGLKRQPPSYCCSVCFRVRRSQELVDTLVSEIVIARLAQPDAISMFAVTDSTAADEAQAVMSAVDAKLEIAADQFADDAITGAQLKRITARLRDERKLADNKFKAAQPHTAVAELTDGDVRANWAALPISARREAIESLMRVIIMPAGSGRRFDPEDVVIEWLT
ncbi:MAG: recombinase family protein [Glaciihabitans sp.]|nr:recombinase family protein [Glaciihabitans sp.]